MGRKGDQDYAGTTYRPADPDVQPDRPQLERRLPPPLPPRAGTSPLPILADGFLEGPPPYTETAPAYHSQPLSQSWSSQDPRSSSTQSLVPRQLTDEDGRRTLLLVYLHGFMGNETSFQSFPAHVHNVVTVKLAGSHVVHTKIYPKYKSRKHIEYARDGFSEWLRPHECPDTDVILLGHSMGGILSAEVALLEGHRILGTINFDTPFLGMHPGVIASGLGSLFKSVPESPLPEPAKAPGSSQTISGTTTNGRPPSSTSSSYFGPNASSESTVTPTVSNLSATLPIPSSCSPNLPVSDPNYDPPFVNDVRLPQRSGWANALHFINKHSDGLTKATQSYVKSHLEFGGAMADYNGLRKRYEKVRALENGRTPEGSQAKRVRFVNYYTASTGRPKQPKNQKSDAISRTQSNPTEGQTPKVEHGLQDFNLDAPSDRSPPSSVRISVDSADDKASSIENAENTHESQNGAAGGHIDDERASSFSDNVVDHVDPDPLENDGQEGTSPKQDGPTGLETCQAIAVANPDLIKQPSVSSSIPPPNHNAPNLPPIPPAPEEPLPFDPSTYTDKDTRKLAEKEHARLLKHYRQVIKDRDKAINDRRRFLEKREKNLAKEREKLAKAEDKERSKLEQRGMEKGERERAKLDKQEAKKQAKETAKIAPKKPSAQTTPTLSPSPSPEPNEPPKRDKKFCMLPPKLNNQLDPCWVRVFMPGVDEVGAHCGLFTIDGERYEGFVDDVAGRIEGWIREGRERKG